MTRLWLLSAIILLGSIANAIELQNFTPEQLRTIRKDFPVLSNTSPSPSQLDEVLKHLYSSGGYQTLMVLEKPDGRIVLRAVPVKRIKEVRIQGASALSEAEIKSTLGIQSEDKFDRAKVDENIKALKAKYSEHGYFNSVVVVNYAETPENEIVVNIRIQEGVLCRITSVRFVTNNEELKKDLLKRTKRYLKRGIEQDTINDMTQEIQNYFADNRFLVTAISSPEVSFNADKTTADISFSIERPYRFVLFLEGNQYFKSNEILQAISVNSQNPTGANPSAELAERIKVLYLEKGFANVDVAFDEKVYSQAFTRQVTFRINEGLRVRVKKVDLIGNYSKDLDWYVDFIADHSNGIKSHGYYYRNDLDKTLEEMIYELQNEGFLKAKIKSTRVEYSKNRDSVVIQIMLEEGPLTRVESVEFKGNTTFSESDLRGAIEIQPKAPLSLKTLEASVKKLEDFYHSHGYIDMAVMNPINELVSYSDDNTKAKIFYSIHEGPQVKVASISIEGNEKTFETVILRELEFSKSDILTPERINDSIYRLQRLGLFSEVTISTLEKGTAIADRTVIVRVVERNPGIFTSGIGLNTEFDLTLRGYLGVGYRNLGGTARALTGRIELNRVTDIDFMDHRLTTGYLEPHLFGSRTRGLVNLTRAYSIKKRDRSRKQVIATDTNELELLLEREYFRHLKLTWNLWSIASIIDFELDDQIPSESQVIATIGPTVELDYRDNPFNPARGFFTRINTEYSDPALGSSRKIKYIRTNGVVSHYIPLSSTRWVWANSVRGGFIKNMDPEGGIPDTKLFTLGGRSTIRGFDTGVIPDRDTLKPVKTESHFYLFKSEFRFPISGDLGGVLFYDGGAVKILCDKEDSTYPANCLDTRSEYRDAAGVGIRYNTPVGPVSAEYGYKLDRNKAREDEGRFHFSIGTF